MKNKEVADKLVEYFLTQDPKIVARVAANSIIDLNRVFYMSKLSNEELKSLFIRMDRNTKALANFVQNGPQGDLTVGELDNE
jgi:hypothetical protein